MSGINNPSNIGFLMPQISKLRPKKYEEWEKYFLKNIASPDKMKKFAYQFADMLEDKYKNENILCYVYCRLIYETFLGYISECKAAKKFLALMRNEGYNIKQYGLSGYDDNKYAVDRIEYINGIPLFGIQIKSVNYKKSKRDILIKTKEINKRKNELFFKEKGIPVFYVFYDSNNECVIVNFEELLVEINTYLSNLPNRELLGIKIPGF